MTKGPLVFGVKNARESRARSSGADYDRVILVGMLRRNRPTFEHGIVLVREHIEQRRGAAELPARLMVSGREGRWRERGDVLCAWLAGSSRCNRLRNETLEAGLVSLSVTSDT